MKELLFQILQAVIIAVVPIISAYAVKLIKQTAEKIKTDADTEKEKSYIAEIAKAISDAVAATSQTFVDALKKNGEFTLEAQQEAAEKALTACLASISPAAKAFLEQLYGDVNAYLANKIEAEVRRQKIVPDTASIAASTAAATTATIAAQKITEK